VIRTDDAQIHPQDNKRDRMSERAEIIRKRFLRRLHRAFFHTVPNDAPKEVDLSKLKRTLEPEGGFEFSFEWPRNLSRRDNTKGRR
jgi:hypothetical protein